MTLNYLTSIKQNLIRHNELLEVCDWSDDVLSALLVQVNETMQDIKSCIFIINDYAHFANIFKDRLSSFASEEQIVVILRQLKEDMEEG
jgi:hypothetical protein